MYTIFHRLPSYFSNCLRYLNLLSALSTLWNRVLYIIQVTLRVKASKKQQPLFPLTDEQQQAIKEKFISDLSLPAICQLASRHNGGRDCQIIRIANGGYNACFFVEFPDDGTKWVVRIAIEHGNHDCWAKVQNEVTTMRYVSSNTTIPVPRVHAFGRERGLTLDGFKPLAYIIIDFIAGKSLELKALVMGTRERRDYFNAQLANIFTQLRQLEFSSPGSLTLDSTSGAVVVGPLLPKPDQALQFAEFKDAAQPAVLTSATDYILNQFEILRNMYSLPVSEQSLQDAQKDVFALQKLEVELRAYLSAISRWDQGPFVLSHTDLRWQNIIVDDDLTILSIIDWEWAASIPLPLFVPPYWIAGTPQHWVTRRVYRAEFALFYKTLVGQCGASNGPHQLVQEWHPNLLDSPELPMALLLCEKSELLNIFYSVILPRDFGSRGDEVVESFFTSSDNKALASEAQQRWEVSKQYTRFLKNEGLFRSHGSPHIQNIQQRFQEFEAKRARIRKTTNGTTVSEWAERRTAT